MKRQPHSNPLVRAVELRNKARRSKAHPKLIARLDTQVSMHAWIAVEQFRKTEDQFPVLSSILNQGVLK